MLPECLMFNFECLMPTAELFDIKHSKLNIKTGLLNLILGI